MNEDFQPRGGLNVWRARLDTNAIITELIDGSVIKSVIILKPRYFDPLESLHKGQTEKKM